MSIEQKNLDKLSRLLQAMDTDSLTRADFTKAFKEVVAFVKKIEKKNIEDVGLMSKALTEASDKLKNTTTSDFGGLKDNINKIVTDSLTGHNNKFDKKISELDFRISTIKDGVDADEEKVADRVREMIEIPTIEELKDQLPVMGEEVRDALELLPSEDEDGIDQRLDISAIKGLDKLIKKDTKGTTMMGGTMNIFFIDDEVPTGTVNGTNKAFTVNNFPSPATSLKVFVNGQKMKLTEDYTFGSKTITFVTAPPTGSILLVDYRM